MIKELKKQNLAHDIAALPDHIVGRAEYLKDYFDRNVYEVLEEVISPLIDALSEEGGADEIGAAGFSTIPAGTVQSQLEALKGMMDEMQWGIPDSLGGEVIKDGAVSKAKLDALVQDALEERFYPMQEVKQGSVFGLTGEVSGESCTLRFVADAAYVKGNTLTVNGDGYTLMMPNGKALPEGAWVSGAVVCLQLNPETKTAFFNGGGADLSFVTASAEQILAGFIGADGEGEPIEGVHRCMEGFESGMVFTGTIAAGGTVNTSVTLACGKRPKVVLTTACFKDKLTIDANANTISGIDGQVGVGITADGVAAFEGRHYDFNVRRHKAIINDTGFVIECQNLGTSQTGGYYCDWIAFY